MMILLITAVSMAAAEDAPAMWMVQNGDDIDLMVNTSSNVSAVSTYVDWNSDELNITNIRFDGSPWQPLTGPGWAHLGGYVSLALTNFDEVMPGEYKIATMEVDCLNEGTFLLYFTNYDLGPDGVNIYDLEYIKSGGSPPKDSEVATYTVMVYEGQSTTIVINAADFGSMKRGATGEIIDSLTLTNGGDMDATLDASFITNVSATYGMVSGMNVIPGNEFSMGEDGAEVALAADGAAVYIGIVPANSAVDYDAILNIPSDAESGAYSGDVEVEYR